MKKLTNTVISASSHLMEEEVNSYKMDVEGPMNRDYSIPKRLRRKKEFYLWIEYAE